MEAREPIFTPPPPPGHQQFMVVAAWCSQHVACVRVILTEHRRRPSRLGRPSTMVLVDARFRRSCPLPLAPKRSTSINWG
jgi:hypothetical protein